MCNTIFIGICSGRKMKQTSIKHRSLFLQSAETCLVPDNFNFHYGPTPWSCRCSKDHTAITPIQWSQTWHVLGHANLSHLCGMFHVSTMWHHTPIIPSYMVFPSSSYFLFLPTSLPLFGYNRCQKNRTLIS